MTEKPNSREIVETSNQYSDIEVDLKQIAGALIRHKFLIGKIAAATFLLSGFYCIISKPVWEGQFEIVLANNKSPTSQTNQLLNNNPSLASLIGAGASNDQLKTEVEILKSPSVLKPVFDFVKDQKQSQGQIIDGWRYKDWIDSNLTIKLVKGTSVLELAYKDTDRYLVLPVIQKISDAYQSYSGRDRKRGINQGIKYLDDQIKTYSIKSINALRVAQEYGIEQNLTVLQGDDTDDTKIKNSLSIEAIRITAVNEIRNINEQLKQLNKLDNNPETLMYIGRNMPELASQGLSQSLDEMDTQLAMLRAKYTDQDNSIRRLLEKRRLLVEVFKQQTYGYLYAQRNAAQARLKAAERPKGVLIKYRELLRTAARYEKTLTKLESERQLLALEQAREEEPWELISTPTLLDNPIAPRKKQIIALGLLSGLVFGSIAALISDRLSGLIYSREELRSLLPFPLLKHLPSMPQDTWTDALDLLASGPLAKDSEDGAIALIPLGNMPCEQIEAFSAELKRALKNRKLILSTDLRETSRCATQLLVATPGTATRTQVSQFCQKLALQGAPVSGWILLDPELHLG